ncbi:beta-ketoacyl-ACP synthase 3 [Paracoccus laeviglucosivorans]|uniref:Biotin biosynthesis protein BioZ n=1 Tax=Paracoccus laeviglucosivorans TaxID=1197861 RepID=A0A521CZG2_9RHOB|nr:beta-ketoacyl-ACP synthase 3 [Paracoccus laeviglucosivorans]SMO64141.1 biotin biosynthesis protein BioZ [Paracoccus laeviglucosivorans]
MFLADGVRMAGFGHYLPERRVLNAEIEAEMDLPPGWIQARCGIQSRHYAADTQALSDLAIPAGRMALGHCDPARVGLLLLATSTPDHLLPPTAPLVAGRLGLACGAVDLAGACSGFLHALALGAAHVRMTGQAVLVIAANLLSRRIDPAEVATRVLFADAAGAVLLEPGRPGQGPRAVVLRSDGGDYDAIRIARGGSRLPFTAPGQGGLGMTMPDGRAVFARAVQAMAASARQALAQAALTPADVALWVPHQANARILDKVADCLGMQATPTLGTLALHGNSSAATIPLALSWHGGVLPDGPLLLSAFGAGTIWGAMVWQQ